MTDKFVILCAFMIIIMAFIGPLLIIFGLNWKEKMIGVILLIIVLGTYLSS